MSVSDFLFNGSPPPSVTTYGSSTAGLPQWYSDYTQSLLAKANTVTGEDYQPYGAPRVADFTDDQLQSFDNTRDSVGAWSPVMSAGVDSVAGAANMDALGAAQPYLDQAGQTADQTVNKYMNPYTDAVVDRLGDLGARNLNEKFMPAIGDQFTRAGQYGSTRMQESTGRALRDVSESTLAAQNQALQQGYGQALTAAQTDLSRAGQLGQVAGNLTNTGQSNLISAGTKLGDMAGAGQNMDIKDNAALLGVGGLQQQLDQTNMNTAYGDFKEQVAYPTQQLSTMNAALRGMSIPTSTNTTQTAPASNYSASPLASLTGGLAGISSLFKAKGGLVRQSDRRRPVRHSHG